MEIKNWEIGGNHYQMVNESWSRGYRWGHKSTLFVNGNEVNSRSITYINRTWEMYQYQSSMRACINDRVEQELEQFICNYKNNNDIVRFKKGQKAEVEQMFYEQDRIKNYKKLLEEIGR